MGRVHVDSRDGEPQERESSDVDNRQRSPRYDHDEHDAGYASTSAASVTSGGSHSGGSSERDGYEAQDEMQLDDDDYEGGVGISMTSRAASDSALASHLKPLTASAVGTRTPTGLSSRGAAQVAQRGQTAAAAIAIAISHP